MCGIVGQIGSEANEISLLKMLEAQKHRGARQ